MTATKLLRCPTCNHASPAPKGGVIFRVGVSGSTRILKRCPVCDKLKFQVLERGARSRKTADGPAPGGLGADRELTLQELAAYVSEKSMDIETAEAIASSAAPEARKREIGALVAEGALEPADAKRLLVL